MGVSRTQHKRKCFSFLYVLFHTLTKNDGKHRAPISVQKEMLSTYSSLLPFKVNSVVALERRNMLIQIRDIYFLREICVIKSKTVYTRNLPNIFFLLLPTNVYYSRAITYHYLCLFQSFLVPAWRCSTTPKNIYPRTSVHWTCSSLTDTNGARSIDHFMVCSAHWAGLWWSYLSLYSVHCTVAWCMSTCQVGYLKPF